MSRQIELHQHTVRKTIRCEGIGLHSGEPVNMAIKPAPENNGIRFFRCDLTSHRHIQAHMDKIVDTRRSTTISDNGITVATTEHLMAALLGFGIDNADIELDGVEVPIMDGSAGPFMHLLTLAGKRKQTALRKVLRITKEITYQDGDSFLRILPYNGFKISGKIDFNDQVIQTQHYSINLTEGRFAKEIAMARTFGYAEQVEELWKQGLALGVNLSNVIAIHWDRKSVLNEEGLRFNDEFIRHKVLDLVGDLALLGCPVLGHVTAHCSGHTQHLAFMQAIAQATDCWELVELNQNGHYSVLDQVMSSTKAAGDMLAPLFRPQPTQPAIAPAASC